MQIHRRVLCLLCICPKMEEETYWSFSKVMASNKMFWVHMPIRVSSQRQTTGNPLSLSLLSNYSTHQQLAKPFQQFGGLLKVITLTSAAPEPKAAVAELNHRSSSSREITFGFASPSSDVHGIVFFIICFFPHLSVIMIMQVHIYDTLREM